MGTSSMSRMSYSISRGLGSDSETDSEEELNKTIRDNRMTTSGLMRDLGLNKKGGNLMTMSLDLRFAELSSLVEDVKDAHKEVKEELGEIEIRDFIDKQDGGEDKRLEELFKNLPSASAKSSDSSTKQIVDVEASL